MDIPVYILDTFCQVCHITKAGGHYTSLDIPYGMTFILPTPCSWWRASWPPSPGGEILARSTRYLHPPLHLYTCGQGGQSTCHGYLRSQGDREMSIIGSLCLAIQTLGGIERLGRRYDNRSIGGVSTLGLSNLSAWRNLACGSTTIRIAHMPYKGHPCPHGGSEPWIMDSPLRTHPTHLVVITYAITIYSVFDLAIFPLSSHHDPRLIHLI